MPFGDALLGARVVLLNAVNDTGAGDTEDHTEEEANSELGLYIAVLGLVGIALVLLGPLLWSQPGWLYDDPEPYTVVLQGQPAPPNSQAVPGLVQGQVLRQEPSLPPDVPQGVQILAPAPSMVKLAR